MESKLTAIGIDLGTTNSCAAVFRNNTIQIIPDDQGHRITPSYVSFTDSERLIGEIAKQKQTTHPKTTLKQFKRLMGRTCDDRTVQKYIKLWPFDVVDEENKPMLEIEFKQETQKFSPEEISAMVLSHLKKAAEAYLTKPVTHAVITVPAYFNDAQRKATIDAGAIAGLKVSMLNEPTAAALAYGRERETKTDRITLIFDLGGGTFDVTILKIEGTSYEVLATGGDSYLGGEDFTNAIYEHVVSTFNRKNKCDLQKNPKSVCRLQEACEHAKKNLSVSAEANLQVEALYNGIQLNETISRSKFEDLNYDLFKKTINTVQRVMDDAKLTKKDIKDILLVGGSTRIPKIREMLETFFDKHLLQTVSADEAIAHGAAVKAASFPFDDCSDMENEVKKLDLKEVASLSLGIESRTSDMAVVIPRNTRIPVKRHETFTTRVDNQNTIRFPVYEGERPCTKDNHHLGTFTLKNIPPLPKGEPVFDVCFDVSSAGVLTVTATDKATGKSNNIVISDDKGRLSQKDIDRMIEKAEKFKKSDDAYRRRSDFINTFEDFIYRSKRSADELRTKGTLSQLDEKKIREQCERMAEWLEANKKTAELNILHEKKNKLESICYPIFQNPYGN